MVDVQNTTKKEQFIEIHGKKLQVKYVQTDDGATITSVLVGVSWMDIRQYHATTSLL